MQGLGYQFFWVMPGGLMTFLALDGIVSHPDSFRALAVTPTLWLDSIALVDPYGVLPVLSALAVLSNQELNGIPPDSRDKESQDTARYMRYVIRGASLAFVPLTAHLPAGFLVFMATNAFYTAGLTWGVRNFLWSPPYVDPSWVVKVPKVVWR
eukprot:NODE_15692_length_1036_cov_3.361936.p2 GENE.NODE_15692_length_1036_cov_3.361936~~NODE_15692_length_1036_cov_3.361936.p2  ORF type:complete len:153 (-),score=39.44 NODE_15692_length_1036_cov_3.361936:381-839(-)